MNQLEILIPIVGILMGGTIVLLPIAGLTARFALKPVVEAWARLKSSPDAEQRLHLVERRLALMEEQINVLERENLRLTEEIDFRGKLSGGSR